MTDDRAYREEHPPACGCIDCAMEAAVRRTRRRLFLDRPFAKVVAGALFVGILVAAIVLVSVYVIA